MVTIGLVLLAIAPPILFLIYIVRMDSVEPEPVKTVLRAVVLGAISVIPAAFIESVGLSSPIFKVGGFIGAGLQSFVVIAPVEEGVKLLVVMLFLWRSRNFNEENDGIVYTGAVAIGFAMLENVFYVVGNGFGNGIMRALTSIPLHTFTGVLMGYFIGLAKFAATGRIGKIAAGFFIAWLLHAVYDTFALSGTAAGLLIIPLVIMLVIFGGLHLNKGQLLSHKRWDGVSAGMRTPTDMPRPARGKGTWKIVIARFLFTVCAVFWALLIAGVVTDTKGKTSNTDALIGGVILTIVPVMIGIILEISRARQRKR